MYQALTHRLQLVGEESRKAGKFQRGKAKKLAGHPSLFGREGYRDVHVPSKPQGKRKIKKEDRSLH